MVPKTTLGRVEMWGASLPKILGGAETSVPKMGMLDMEINVRGQGKCVDNYF